jgi:TetR/AcrR family transcriptional regulator, repressor for uid operon
MARRARLDSDNSEKAVVLLPPRLRVLGAALRCFAAKGFHGTSMHEICAAAGMSPGALYRHFPSKDSIIAAIAEQERESNARFFKKLEVDENILETLMDTGFAWMRDIEAREGAALCVEVLAEAHRNPLIREIFERNHVEARAALRGSLERAQIHGEVDRELDLDVAVTVFMALGDGLLARAPLDAHMAPDRIEPGLRILLRRMLQPKAHGQQTGASPGSQRASNQTSQTEERSR